MEVHGNFSMKNDELYKISEEIFINSISSDVVKQAGLFEDLGFPGLASSIKNAVKEHVVNEDSPSGYLGALGNVLLTGSLFKINPVLGIAYAVAEALGIDVIGMIKRIFGAASEAVNNGQTLSEGEFDSLAKTAFRKEDLTKISQLFGRKRYYGGYGTTPTIPFLPPKGESSIIHRVFGNLFARGQRTKASWLAKGILLWALKTALLGAGLLTATGTATSLIKGWFGDKEKSETEKPEVSEKIKDPGMPYVVPEEAFEKVRFKSSGSGEKYFKNDLNNVWIVPLINSNIEDTLLAWTAEIYPELSGYGDIIEKTPSFKRTTDLLRGGYSFNTPNSLMVPQGLHTRKQIVDLFVQDLS